jgi:hypothetical protein
LQADLYRDPLRQLALSDLRLPVNSTMIDRMRIVAAAPAPGAGGSGADGIQMYREVTWSRLDNETIEAVGELRSITGSRMRHVQASTGFQQRGLWMASAPRVTSSIGPY